MKTILSFGCVVLLALGFPSAVLAAPNKSGTVEVTKVTGSVTDAKSQPVKAGSFLKQGDQIITGDKSEAGLLFSNGTRLVVQEKSEFSVTKFLQDPFDATKVDITNAKAEPTSSVTAMALNKGTIIGDVAKLGSGSQMTVTTPLGTAGIRGTTFSITVVIESDGGYRATIKVTDGRIDFRVIDGSTRSVGPGRDATEITIRLRKLDEFPAQIDTTNLTETELNELNTQLQQAIDNATTAATPPGTGTGGGFDSGVETAGNVGTLGGGAGGGGGGGGNPTPTPTPTPTPPPPYNN